jgi:hypothetical protein
MNTNKTPSKALTMKIDRTANTIEIQWDRKSQNIDQILKNLKLFNIELTSNITKQISNLPTTGSKNYCTDIIYI